MSILFVVSLEIANSSFSGASVFPNIFHEHKTNENGLLSFWERNKVRGYGGEGVNRIPCKSKVMKDSCSLTIHNRVGNSGQSRSKYWGGEIFQILDAFADTNGVDGEFEFIGQGDQHPAFGSTVKFGHN